eukprot:439268_1
MSTVYEPTICDASTQQYSGQLDAGISKNGTTNQYFYWLFESKNDPQNAPLLMWLNGGPGCSSMFGLFLENGPCKLINNGTSINDVKLNPYSWNSNANLMFVDQPPSVGFSTGPFVSTFEEISQNMHQFLQHFMKLFPQYFKNGFFIAGESYAGKFIPNIMNYIHKQNKNNPQQIIPLTGFIIGNGDTDPLTQLFYVPQMAYNSSIAINSVSNSLPITKQKYNEIMSDVSDCMALIIICRNKYNEDICSKAKHCESDIKHRLDAIEESGLNKYNLHVEGDYNEIINRLSTYLNLDTVQKSIGISTPIIWTKSVHEYHHNLGHSGASVENSGPLLEELLNDGIRGLVLAGEWDFICNWMGNEAWTLNLNWKGQMSYKNAKRINWEVNGKVAGEIRQGVNTDLTFIRVFKAGHLVPMDQPEVALELINEFLSDTLRSSELRSRDSFLESHDIKMIISLSVSGWIGLLGIVCVLLLLMIAIYRIYKRRFVSRKGEWDGIVIV